MKEKESTERETVLLTSNLLHEDPDLIDLIDKFMTRLPAMQEGINLAHQQGDQAELSSLVHQLKGVGGGYGYPMLTELCARMESQIASKDEGSVAMLLKEFNEMVQQILDGHEENHRIIQQFSGK